MDFLKDKLSKSNQISIPKEETLETPNFDNIRKTTVESAEILTQQIQETTKKPKNK
jgi:hypothetical protein